MNYKTPGVYIEEVPLFPPSVVAVPTAIPAFIGYTQQATGPDGDSLSGIPTRITSILEYRLLFGGRFTPDNYLVTLTGTGATTEVSNVQTRDGSDNVRRYYTYDAIELFYQNGGGPCYIVSIGTYGDEVDDADIEGGINAVAIVDEPTLLLFPDAVTLMDGNNPDLANFSRLQNLALAQCDTLKDRFVIMDLIRGNQAISVSTNPITDFRNNIGTSALQYGAAYYPWIISSQGTEISFRNLNFQDGALAAISNTDLDTLLAGADNSDFYTTLLGKIGDTDALVATMAGLSINTFSPLRAQYDNLVTTFRTAAANDRRDAFSDIMGFLRSIALGLETLNGATLSTDSAVAAQVTSLSTDANLIEAITDLIAIEKNAGVRTQIMPPADGSRTEGDVDTEYGALSSTDWVGGVLVSAIAADATIAVGGGTILDRGNVVLAHSLFLGVVNKLLATYDSLFNLALTEEQTAEANLFNNNPLFSTLVDQIRTLMRTVPSSGAVAGIYAAIDRTRGVWKAPANVSLNGVIGPAVKITNRGQEDLNVTTTGKSINAIRAFAGKGTLIWGARTLAGNDNEWRYVSVRRFFNMVEESVKKASEPFVFEPNNANTWVKISGMIQNFLTVQWRQGALAGAKTEDAFFVKVGLGQTMTAQDILEGRLIVEIGMAVVRPAEFIILRFMHKMQEA